jgi:hypothetical protein
LPHAERLLLKLFFVTCARVSIDNRPVGYVPCRRGVE